VLVEHKAEPYSGDADSSAAGAVDKSGLPEAVLLVFRAQQQQAFRLWY